MRRDLTSNLPNFTKKMKETKNTESKSWKRYSVFDEGSETSASNHHPTHCSKRFQPRTGQESPRPGSTPLQLNRSTDRDTRRKARRCSVFAISWNAWNLVVVSAYVCATHSVSSSPSSGKHDRRRFFCLFLLLGDSSGWPTESDIDLYWNPGKC